MFIKSPINYTGNKYRILDQMFRYMPKKFNVFVDLFSGGATVGFNVCAEKIILVDSNEKVINLLKVLAENDFEKIIITIEKIIEEFGLSYSYKYGYKKYKKDGYIENNNGLKRFNSDGFYKLREKYNTLKNKKTFRANIMLYVLMVYGFNNDLRFNSKGEYNLPVGKTDFNKNNFNKILAFNNRAKMINYEFICCDFKNKELVEKIINENAFVYCDPPYLITNAVYNENKGWTEKDELDLLEFLKNISKRNINFALSNVLKKTDCQNDILKDWISENGYRKHKIDYHYRSSSYNKKNRNSKEEEILVTNV